MTLPAGVQIIVEEHTPSTIRLYHPLGNATALVVQLPPSWPIAGPVAVTAHDAAGQILTTTTINAVGGRVTVPYLRTIAAHPVDHYRLRAVR